MKNKIIYYISIVYITLFACTAYSSDLNLDTTAEDIKEDEFTCSICFMILGNTQLAKPRSKVCIDCV